MEEHGNNRIFGVGRKQMWAVDGKQKIYLEWPNYVSIQLANRLNTCMSV